MNKSPKHTTKFLERRKRLHQLLIALIQQQKDLELIDVQAPAFDSKSGTSQNHDPAILLDRNRRLIKRYQALVRSAITFDALLDSETSDASEGKDLM